MPALEVNDVTVWFEGQEQPAVEHVSFALDQGQIATLIGPNGSGKSTLLKAILGLVRFDGEVRIFGAPAAEARRQVGYVPQRLSFDATLPLTVREAVRMPLLGARSPDVDTTVRHYMEALGNSDMLDERLAPWPVARSSARSSHARWSRAHDSCCSTSRKRESTSVVRRHSTISSIAWCRTTA